MLLSLVLSSIGVLCGQSSFSFFLDLLSQLNLLVQSGLPFLGVLLELSLSLLLSQSVQELVRLSEDLWHQSVLVEVLDVEDFAT